MREKMLRRLAEFLLAGLKPRHYILLVVAGLLVPNVGVGRVRAPKGYTLVWSDEFKGKNGSLPDAAKWTFDIGGNGWGNHELEYYTNRPENARIERGKLVITARAETYTGPDGKSFSYTSARLKTQGLFSQHQAAGGAGNLAGLLDAWRKYCRGRLAEMWRDRHHGKHRQGTGD